MQAKITAETGYRCAPTGAVVVHYPQGWIVDGKAAEYALADGAATPWPVEEKKIVSAPEIKRGRRK